MNRWAIFGRPLGWGERAGAPSWFSFFFLFKGATGSDKAGFLTEFTEWAELEGLLPGGMIIGHSWELRGFNRR
jgi:hypothetical protein